MYGKCCLHSYWHSNSSYDVTDYWRRMKWQSCWWEGETKTTFSIWSASRASSFNKQPRVQACLGCWDILMTKHFTDWTFHIWDILWTSLHIFIYKNPSAIFEKKVYILETALRFCCVFVSVQFSVTYNRNSYKGCPTKHDSWWNKFYYNIAVI